MKLLQTKCLIIVLLCLTSFVSMAQQTETRPFIYANRAQSINLASSTLENALNLVQGTTATVQLATDFPFTGSVISNFKRNEQLHTVIIRSSEHAGSYLHITQIINRDNSISYTGRILNTEAADGFMLKNNNGNYSLQKFESMNIFNPCNF
jgi:hypothetical protein